MVDNLETLLDTERNWQDENYQQFFSRWKQQGTNSTLFITTQDKPQLFQDLQHWYFLGGMKIEEGIILLNKLAIQGAEAELKNFVQYVDGHPLTINLVASFLREYCDSQLSQIEELGLEKFELAYQEAEGLHRNKQDARLSWIIQQHLDRLTEQQTNFLINLSVYRVPFNREAASYMLVDREVKPIIIQKKLQELCDRSLLKKTQDNQFNFESLLQKYILQQAKDLTNAHQNAINFYLYNLQSQPWNNFEDISEYIETSNHWLELKKYALAFDILARCLNFLELRGYYVVSVEVIEKLVHRWQLSLKSEERIHYASASYILGCFYQPLGKLDQAIKYLEQSLAISREIDDCDREGLSLMGLGNVYNSLGEYKRAIEYFKQSLVIAHQIENLNEPASLLKAGNLMGLGTAYDYLGEYKRAISFHQKSLAIAQQINDTNAESLSLNSLGNAHQSLGDFQQAIDYFQQSLRIAQENRDLNTQSICLNNLGNVYKHIGEYHRVIDYYQQSINISQEISNLHLEATSLGNLGDNYNYLGEYQQAIYYSQKSLNLKRQIGDRNGEAGSLGTLGDTYIYLGEYQQAIDYLHQSLNIQRQIGDRIGEAGSLTSLGIVYRSLGEYQKFIYYSHKSIAIFRQIGDLHGEGVSLNNLGIAYDSLGEYQLAIDYAQKSLDIKRQIGDLHGEGLTLNNLGSAYNSLGEYRKAKDYFQQSVAIKNKVGDKRGEAKTWFNLGNTQKNLQEKLEAKVAYENARKLYREIGLDKDVEYCDREIEELKNNDSSEV